MNSTGRMYRFTKEEMIELLDSVMYSEEFLVNRMGIFGHRNSPIPDAIKASILQRLEEKCDVEGKQELEGNISHGG
jgi:hypothetical protein